MGCTEISGKNNLYFFTKTMKQNSSHSTDSISNNPFLKEEEPSSRTEMTSSFPSLNHRQTRGHNFANLTSLSPLITFKQLSGNPLVTGNPNVILRYPTHKGKDVLKLAD